MGIKLFQSLIAKSMTMFIGVISIAILVSWIIDVDLLQSIITDYPPVKVATATMFIFVSVLNWSMLTWKREMTDIKSGILGTSMMSLFIFSMLMLIEVFSKPNLGFSYFMIEDNNIGSIKAGYPGLMTISLFLLQSVVGLVYIYNTVALRKRLNILASIFLVLSLSPIIGKILDIPILYYYIEGYSTPMSLIAALFFLFNSYIVKTISYDNKHCVKNTSK